MMADILVVRCNMLVPKEQLQYIYYYLRHQKESGVILLPPYLEAQIVPDDVKIKLVDENGKDIDNDQI